MAKALPRKWFASRYVARISLAKVDKWAEFHKSVTPYFDSWEEAHAHMKEVAAAKLKAAKRDLASAERYKARVAEMKPPNGPHEGEPACGRSPRCGG